MATSKLKPVERPIVTEVLAIALIAASLLIALSLFSYDPSDPSFNVANGKAEASNMVGWAGSWMSDLLLQSVGLLALLIPVGFIAFGIRGFVANRIGIPIRLWAGLLVLTLAVAGFVSLLPKPGIGWLTNASATGGLVGLTVSHTLSSYLNSIGAGIVLGLVILITATLTMQMSIVDLVSRLFGRETRPSGSTVTLHSLLESARERFAAWREARRDAYEQRLAERQREEENVGSVEDREREERRKTEELVREGLLETSDVKPVRRRTQKVQPVEDETHVDDSQYERRVPKTDRLTPPESTILDTLVEEAEPPEPPRLTPLEAAKAKIAEARSRRARAIGTNGDSESASGTNGDDPSHPASTPIAPELIDPDVAEMVSTASIVRTTPIRQAQATKPQRGYSTANGYTLPSTELLTAPPASSEQDERELEQRALTLAEKCKEFSVTGHIHRINPGPVVTTFEFKPDPGIKYSRVVGLADDLCLALKAESIRIDRIPGKSTVGIEVPNENRQTIFLRQIIESEAFQEQPSKLTLALGQTIDGLEYVADLQKMPHLLIAGSTGSGKSVMINTIVTSILFKAAPDEVKFIMVDPKRLELGLYEGIPHLLTPIVVDPKRAANALKWAVTEMENRYRTLAGYGVRNIEQYNKEVRSIINQNLAMDSADLPKPLPYIVVLIDELADLMMVASSDVESSITRLAQMARAIGIHLVLATQRPSVDVITGLIKANFPSRMSFRVSSKVDSRTIIDANGAEQLLGQGDMLFLPPGSSRLVRVHGSFLSEKDVKAVMQVIKQQGTPDYDDSVTMSPQEQGGIEGGERDELFDDALKIVCDMGRASTSVLQRRLRVGYGRAAAILDQMEAAGFVGPPDGSRPRVVMPSAYEFYERNSEILEERQNEL